MVTDLMEQARWAKMISDIEKSNALDDLYYLLEALKIVKTRYSIKQSKYKFIL